MALAYGGPVVGEKAWSVSRTRPGALFMFLLQLGIPATAMSGTIRITGPEAPVAAAPQLAAANRLTGQGHWYDRRTCCYLHWTSCSEGCCQEDGEAGGGAAGTAGAGGLGDVPPGHGPGDTAGRPAAGHQGGAGADSDDATRAAGSGH